MEHVTLARRSDEPDAEAMLLELRRLFNEALLELPENELDVFLPHHIKGAPFPKIARSLDVSETAVRRRFAASVRSLRKACRLPSE